MRRLLTIVAALFFSLTATSVWAQDGASRCYDGDFVEQALDNGAETYRVAVPGRSYFRQGGDGCPSAASCQLKSYVIGKNQVLVSRIEHGWACAWYGGTSAQTVGWLRAADLAKTATLTVKINWLGHWSLGENGNISITRDARGGLRVEGDMVNMGRLSMPSGAFDGDLLVDGPNGLYSDFDAEADARYRAQFPGEPSPPHCTVRFRRVDRYLIVADGDSASPWGCGGMGAGFTGVYSYDGR